MSDILLSDITNLTVIAYPNGNQCKFHRVQGFHFLEGGKTMAKKEKRMCKWSEKDLDEKFDKFTAIVTNPKFVCKKCLRVADKKKWLHKPAPLK